MRIFIDRFTVGLEDLKRKEQADISKVLAVMQEHGRFSVFEATANQTIAKTVDRIMLEGFVKNLGGGYPWTEIELTEKGRLALEGLFWHGPEEDPLKDYVKIGKRTYAPKAMVESFLRENKKLAQLWEISGNILASEKG